MKLNKKGFAITAIIYSILTIVVILMMLTLALISSRRSTVEKMQEKAREDITKRDMTTDDDIQTVTDGAIAMSFGDHNSNTFGDFSTITEADIIPKGDGVSMAPCTVATCYNDNGGKIKYDSTGNMILGGNYPIVSFNIPASANVADAISINLTVKAKFSEQTDDYGTILGIAKIDLAKLAWVAYTKSGNLHINTFVDHNGSTPGVKAISFTSYDNKIVNIQIVAQRGGNTTVYANGKIISEFESGKNKVPFGPLTLGDLRPGRKLKFNGTLYEIVVYDRLLTSDEVTMNYKASKKKYGVD